MTPMETVTDFVHVFQPGPNRDNAPTLLLLHGTGGSERDLLPLGRRLLPTANLLGVRGQVRENGMPRFFRRLSEGVFDEEDLRRRTHELADFLPVAASRHGFDPARVIAVGYSNGANIAGGLLLLRPESLAGAVLLRPMVPLVPDALPALASTPVLIAAGAQDPMVPRAEAERLAALLRDAGASVTTAFQPGGHGLSSADAQATADWLAAHGFASQGGQTPD